MGNLRTLDCLNDLESAQAVLMRAVGEARARKVIRAGMKITDEAARLEWLRGVVSYAAGDPTHLAERLKFKTPPVDLRTFLYDPFYMGVPKDELWPSVVEHLEHVNSGDYIEAILTGAIGTAKTTIALYTQAYQLYLLSCYHNPHKELGIAETDEIIFIFQNLNATLAKVVDYGRFKNMLERSHYFTKVWPFNKDVDSELRFPKHITVKPVSGEVTATIGQNVFGGLIDEVNYMSVVQQSKQSKDGGTYDQAHELYRSIATRRKSRFLKHGKLPGVLCIVSSRNYPGQFTDVKEEEAKKEIAETGKTSIYVYDKRVWELSPEKFSGELFWVFIGDEARKPRILEAGEWVEPEDEHLTMQIPVEFRNDFERDIMEALREIAGVATLARFPFIMETEAIAECIDHESILSRDRVDFQATKVKVYPKRILHPDAPRFAHIDLGLTSDSAGVAIGHVSGFKQILRGDHFEVQPIIVMDLTLEVAPPKGGEIKFHKIRELLYTLRDKAGLPIKWISFDSYQSVDSLQILRQNGFVTGMSSMDTSTLPYELVKSALYDRRLHLCNHDKVRKELASLEKDPKTQKIDHPANGSKDVSDAVAGVVFGLTMRREIWAEHGVLAHANEQLATAMAKVKMQADEEAQAA